MASTAQAPDNSSATFSDLALDQASFNPASISEETHAFNQKLMDIAAKGPKWYEVGASTYRKMRAEGKTPLPAATLLDSARDFSIPSRDPGRSIPCRILEPQRQKQTSSANDDKDDNEPKIKGVFMHIHGGGWVLQDEKSQDPPLQLLADATSTLIVSVGYRLAPENPFPAGPEDCYDAAEWLVHHAQDEFGAPLSFVGGESAGGHLSMLVALHLLQHRDPAVSGFRFRGLLLHFGCYDLSFTPNVYNFRKPATLVLDRAIMEHYREAFVPGLEGERLKEPDLSPLYADLESLRGKLPSALFTCGTEDPLLDDTVFMSAKWMMAGAETTVKIVPGGAHGYIFYVGIPASGFEQGMNATIQYIKTRLSV